MSEDRFIQLVQEHDGFEFYQAFQNDVDHVFGGKGDTYWYTVLKKGKIIMYMALAIRGWMFPNNMVLPLRIQILKNLRRAFI